MEAIVAIWGFVSIIGTIVLLVIWIADDRLVDAMRYREDAREFARVFLMILAWPVIWIYWVIRVLITATK